jgi:cytoskeletal protein CcmA (bactofilin family)
MLTRQDKNHKEISQDDLIAFIGKGTELKGVISYQQGTVRIDGNVEGEIITKGVLVVGETAVIRAEINAGTVISNGKITGNITASERIQLLPTAVLEGTIKTPALIVEEGVRFNGQCQMGSAQTRPMHEVLASVAGGVSKMKGTG